LIHPSAIIEPGVTIGDGSVVSAGSVVATSRVEQKSCRAESLEKVQLKSEKR
jgi:acetyltransferase-like isoleucine patch superfamily enzyme